MNSNQRKKLASVVLVLMLLLTVMSKIERADAAWSLMNDGVSVRAVWGSSAKDVFAVGCAGEMIHYDGNSEGIWSQIEPIQNH